MQDHKQRTSVRCMKLHLKLAFKVMVYTWRIPGHHVCRSMEMSVRLHAPTSAAALAEVCLQLQVAVLPAAVVSYLYQLLPRMYVIPFAISVLCHGC